MGREGGREVGYNISTEVTTCGSISDLPTGYGGGGGGRGGVGWDGVAGYGAWQTPSTGLRHPSFLGRQGKVGREEGRLDTELAQRRHNLW